MEEAGSSPLHLAAWAGNTEVVDILLNTGPSVPNVNLTNADKETALHCAAQYGHTEVVRRLLAAGADPNIKNSKEETALDHAAQYGRIETVCLLLESHPEMVGKYTAYGSMIYAHTPLHLASRNGHTAAVVELLRTGIDINVRTARGSALHEAALCGKVEVVHSLLEHGINPQIKDSADRTVMDVMSELQTARTREISAIIVEHSSRMAGSSNNGANPTSPYDNISLTQSLQSSSSSFAELLASSSSPRQRATTLQEKRDHRRRRRRAAMSVEDLADKRISSVSTTSGCSDCTNTSSNTLQGAKSYDSNFVLSESDLTMTGTLTPCGRVDDDDDDTSISSASSTHSLSPACMVTRPGSTVSQHTLTSSSAKPKLPAKPAHIRPGLKPVQIPNVDDKLGLKPRKPPRRNLSISPVRTNTHGHSHHHYFNQGCGSDQDGQQPCQDGETVSYEELCYSNQKNQEGYPLNFSSKLGSKSFDELDDLMHCGKAGRKQEKETHNGSSHTRKRSRRTLSSVSSTDVLEASEKQLRKQYFYESSGEISSTGKALSLHHFPQDNRYSCDEMISAQHVQPPPKGDGGCSSSSSSHGGGCQRCILNSISNRSLNLDSERTSGSNQGNTFTGQQRFISQRQYKRKIRKEGPRSVSNKCSTFSSRTDNVANGHSNTGNRSNKMNAVLVSKTTYRLHRNMPDSDLDSAGEDNNSCDNNGANNGNGELELMEIPLSPTHFDQPPTPEHAPPNAWEAESAIHSVLSFLKAEYQPTHASTFTLTEPWMLLPENPAQWPVPNPTSCDQATSTRPDKPLGGRKLPDIPCHEKVIELHIATSPESGEEASPESRITDKESEVVLRKKTRNKTAKTYHKDDSTSIYQSIDDIYAEDTDESEPSNRVSQAGSDKSQSLSILSPFDEQEEWSKISQIIDSFGADIGRQQLTPSATAGSVVGGEISTPNNSPVYDYPTLKRRDRPVATTVPEWLRSINMEKYVIHFEANGFDNLAFMGGQGIITNDCLHQIGITESKDINILLESLQQRENKFNFDDNGHPMLDTANLQLDEWLASIDLAQYADNFYNNLWDNMTRMKDIWDEELASIVEIDKVGHRQRILLSLAGPKRMRDQMGKVSKYFQPTTVSVKSSEETKTAAMMSQGMTDATKKKETMPGNETSHLKTSNQKIETVKSVGSNSQKIGHSSKPLVSPITPKPSVPEVIKAPTIKTTIVEDVPLCSLHSAQRRNTSSSATSSSSASLGSDQPVDTVPNHLQQPPSKATAVTIESGTLTLGRRKKKAPPPPTTTRE